MANFRPLMAEIGSGIWGTPANFNGFRVLASLSLLQRRRSLETKLCTMFGRLLGWYTMYTFSGAVAPWRNFARYKIHLASKSCILLYCRVALLWQHNANPSYKLASIPRYDDMVRTAGWAGSARAAGRWLAGDEGRSQNCAPYMGSGRGCHWLARRWLAVDGGVLNSTAADWTAGFHWWRSGNKKRTCAVGLKVVISRKQCKIETLLLRITNRKWCYLLNSGNSDDLEWRSRSFTCNFRLFQVGLFMHLCSSWKISTDVARRGVFCKNVSVLTVSEIL